MLRLILSYKESNVLSAIGQTGEAHTHELSSKTQLPPSEVSKALEKLAQRGLLTVNDNNARLTEEGRAALRKLEQQVRRPSTSSPQVLLIDDESTSAINSNFSSQEIEQSIDDELGKLRK